MNHAYILKSGETFVFSHKGYYTLTMTHDRYKAHRFSKEEADEVVRNFPGAILEIIEINI